MSAAAIDARLLEVSRLAGSLRPESRLDTKIDMSGAAVAARLKQASDLLDLCRVLWTASTCTPRCASPHPGFEVAFLKDTQKNSGLPEGVTTRHTLSFCARAGTPIFHPKTLRSHHE